MTRIVRARGLDILIEQVHDNNALVYVIMGSHPALPDQMRICLHLIPRHHTRTRAQTPSNGRCRDVLIRTSENIIQEDGQSSPNMCALLTLTTPRNQLS